MARIAGVDLPRHKQVAYALPYLYGVGHALAKLICKRANIPPEKKTEELTEAEIKRIRDLLESEYRVEGDLRREVQMNIKRLIEIGSYRGLRHRRNLPVNGQRTRTNSRTRKGTKKTVAGRGRRRGGKK